MEGTSEVDRILVNAKMKRAREQKVAKRRKGGYPIKGVQKASFACAG